MQGDAVRARYAAHCTDKFGVDRSAGLRAGSVGVSALDGAADTREARQMRGERREKVVAGRGLKPDGKVAGEDACGQAAEREPAVARDERLVRLRSVPIAEPRRR